MKGSDIIVNEIAIVRTTTGGTAASVSSFAGVFSPTRASYDLTVRGDALFSGLRNQFVDGEATTPLPVRHRAGRPVPPARAGGKRLRAGGGARRDGDRLHANAGRRLVVRARRRRGARHERRRGADGGRGGGQPERRAHGRHACSPAPARTSPCRLATSAAQRPPSRCTASRAGSVASAAERRIQARRQVIDALVGYGGGGWPGRLGGSSGGIDRGPFVHRLAGGCLTDAGRDRRAQRAALHAGSRGALRQSAVRPRAGARRAIPDGDGHGLERRHA